MMPLLGNADDSGQHGHLVPCGAGSRAQAGVESQPGLKDRATNGPAHTSGVGRPFFVFVAPPGQPLASYSGPRMGLSGKDRTSGVREQAQARLPR
jgi:hypothetical protein